MSRSEVWSKFLDRCLKDSDYRELTNGRIDDCIGLIRDGYGIDEARKHIGVSKTDFGVIFELAHSRIDISGKFEKWNRLWMDRYLSRYSTPEMVCRYRADRIRDMKILEAGSGSGMQSIFLSTTNVSAVGVELMPERYRMAKLNALEYKTGDLKFLNGDIHALSQSFPVDDETVVFSDPARPQSEGERSLDSLLPSPAGLLRVFGDRTGNFVFDLPPQMSWNRITLAGEKEYLSINGSLNRLTLYCGHLQRDEVSSVILPQGTRFSGVPREEEFPGVLEDEEYLFIPDISIVYAKLLWKVREKYDIKPVWRDRRRFIYSSGREIEGFPGEQFKVLSVESSQDINERLRALGAARVFPRFSLRDDNYYSLKNQWESGLKGSEDIHVFLRGDKYVLAAKVG